MACRIAFPMLLVLAATSLASGQESENYAERLEYDRTSRDWVAVASPVPGTEAGDLELARSLLARGEYKRARKAFKRWFKTYPDSSHWQEALFYSADTEVAAEQAKARSGDMMKAYRWYEELIEGSGDAWIATLG